jgi:uncharacterized protein (UPF0128 family)
MLPIVLKGLWKAEKLSDILKMVRPIQISASKNVKSGLTGKNLGIMGQNDSFRSIIFIVFPTVTLR